jgi:hypothetical protein
MIKQTTIVTIGMLTLAFVMLRTSDGHLAISRER